MKKLIAFLIFLFSCVAYAQPPATIDWRQLRAATLAANVPGVQVSAGIPKFYFDHTTQTSLKSALEFRDDGTVKNEFGVDFAGAGGTNFYMRAATSPAQIDFYTSTSTLRGSLGASAAGAYLYNEAGKGLTVEVTTGDVGIGTATPAAQLHTHAIAGANPTFRLTDADVAHGMTIFGRTTDTVLDISENSGTAGGAFIWGMSSSASVEPLTLWGVIGSASPSVAPVMFVAGKKDSATVQPLASSERAFGFRNSSAGGTAGTDLVTILGGGSVGIGTTNPSSFKLQVAGSAGPNTDNSGDLGSTSLRWRTVYAGTSALVAASAFQGSSIFQVGSATAFSGPGDTQSFFIRQDSSADVDQWGAVFQMDVTDYNPTNWHARAAVLGMARNSNDHATLSPDAVGVWGHCTINTADDGRCNAIEADVFMNTTGLDGLMIGIGLGMRSQAAVLDLDMDGDTQKIMIQGGALTSEDQCTYDPAYTDPVTHYADCVAAKKKTITAAATNGANIRMTVPGHGYATGDLLNVSLVGGCVDANWTHRITKIDDNTIDLWNVTCSLAYTSGGQTLRAMQPITALFSNVNDRYQAPVGFNIRRIFGDYIRLGNPEPGAVGFRFLPPSIDGQWAFWDGGMILPYGVPGLLGYQTTTYTPVELFTLGADGVLRIGTIGAWAGSTVALYVNTAAIAQITSTGVNVVGATNTTTFFQSGLAAADTGAKLGAYSASAKNVYIDFMAADASAQSFRIVRESGTNGLAYITHAGTNTFQILTSGAAPLSFATTGTERLNIASGGGISMLPPAGQLVSISNTAPLFQMTDTTGSAKSLRVAVDANVASFYDAADTSIPIAAFDLTNKRVGMGTAAPAVQLHLHTASGSNPSMRLTDADVGHGITLFGRTTDTVLDVSQVSGTAGGALFWGFSDDNAIQGLEFWGIVGGTSPSIAPVIFSAGKKNGATVQAIASTEKAFSFYNSGAGTDLGTALMTILGGGSVGIGTAGPLYKLHVVGTTDVAQLVVAGHSTQTNVIFGVLDQTTGVFTIDADGNMASGSATATDDAAFQFGALNAAGNRNVRIEMFADSGGAYDGRLIRYAGTNGALELEQVGTGVTQFKANGTVRMSYTAGMWMAAATGGDKGAGSINVDDTYYKDGNEIVGGFAGTMGASILGTGVGTSYMTWGSSSFSVGGGENTRQIVATRAGTLKNFYIQTLNAQSGTGSLVFTMRVNGADQTALQITVAAGEAAGTKSDLTGSVAIAAGDLISISVVNNASVSSAQVGGFSVTFGF